MLTRWITYKLTDIFLFIGKMQCIFPDNVFDTSDDSVVHHWKARGRQSSGDQSTSGNILNALSGSRPSAPVPVLPVPASL